MKEILNRFIEITEVTLFEPFRFAEMVASMRKDVKWSGEWITILAAFSLATGSVYITPPYTKSWSASILFIAVMMFLFLRFLPFLLGMVLDFLIREKKERRENIQLAVMAARLLLMIYIFFMPAVVVFVQSGLSGGRIYYLLLFFFTAVYLYFLSSVFSMIYELEWKSSFFIVLKSFGILLLFPLIFNLVFIHSIMKFFE